MTDTIIGQEGEDMRPGREDDIAMRKTISRQQTMIFGFIISMALIVMAGFQKFGNIETQVIDNTEDFNKYAIKLDRHIMKSNDNISNIQNNISVMTNNITNINKTTGEIKADFKEHSNKVISTLGEFGRFHVKTDEAIKEATDFIRHEKRKK